MERKKHPKYEMYSVGRDGTVYNTVTNHKLKKIYSNGYVLYNIQTERGITNSWRTMFAHRMVMETFDPREDSNMLVVDHKDEVRDNNHFSNLEWVTQKENIRRAIGRRLYSYDARTGKFVKEYKAAIAAEKDGFTVGMVLKVADGVHTQTKGYVFRDDKVPRIDISGVKWDNSKISTKDIEGEISVMMTMDEPIRINNLADRLNVTRQTIHKYITPEIKASIKKYNKELKDDY